MRLCVVATVLKRNLPRILLGLAVVFIFLLHASKFIELSFVNRLEYALYDARLIATMPRTLDPRIVILDIDEKSIGELGHFPWSRDKLASIVDKLFNQQKIAMLGFDVVWAEKDTSSGLDELEHLARGELKDDPKFLGQLQQIAPSLNYDGRFADAVRNHAVVLGYVMTDAKQTVQVLPQPTLPAGTFNGHPVRFTHWAGYVGNLPDLENAALSAGHFNPAIDPDGEVRRVPMLVEENNQYYESLSLAMVRGLLGSPGVRPEYPSDDQAWVPKSYSGLEYLDLPYHGKNVRIPVDRDVASLIPYRGPGGPHGGSYQYVSISDVLFDRLKPEELKDKIVLVGTTALGLVDMRSTPVSPDYPGVEVHANMISGMLDGRIKEAPDYSLGAELVTLLVVGLLLSFVLPVLSAVRAVLLTLLVAAALVASNFAIYANADLSLPLASSLLVTVFIFAINMVYGYFVESKTKRELEGLFGSYVPPELVEEMSRDPRAYSMEGRSEELTVMFSDVRGFTTISESLQPKDLSVYINDYLTAMSLIIQTHRGTLDKYIGDAIMAFWGAPVPEKIHAQLAVETALAMQAEVEKLNVQFRARKWPDMQIGIGVSTGVMSVGDMGSKIRRAYTVMGDPVNLGARLEGRTKTYGIGILVSEATRRAVTGVVFREIDRVKVKGKDEAVTIFEPIGKEGEVSKERLDELKLWHATLKAYRNRNWDQVELQLINLQRMSPNDKLYASYLERLSELRHSLAEESWDGVYTFSEK